MKNYIKLLVVLGFMLIFINSNSAASTTSEIQRVIALNYINEYRSYLGVPKLVIDEKLNKSAESHAVYMSNNNLTTTEEEKSKKGFTGVYPWDRAIYFGFDSSLVHEEVAKSDKYLKRVITDMINNPEKRQHILSPEYDKIGIGIIGNYYVLDFSRAKALKEMIIEYPKDKQVGIVNTYPITKFNVSQSALKKQVYPSTLTYYSVEEIASVKNISCYMRNTTSWYSIPTTYTLTNNKNRVMVTANSTETLIAGNSYEVTISYTVDFTNKSSKVVTKKWSFTADKSVNVDDMSFSYKSPVVAKKVNDAGAHWAESAINEFYSRNYISVDTNGNYSPNKVITRAEIAEMIFKALELTENKSAKEFKDVPSSKSYHKYINSIYKYGIMNGTSETEFSPDKYLTREEMAVILINAYEKVIGKAAVYVDSNFLSDINECQTWSRESVKKAMSIGLIKGKENNTFDPKGQLTRAEAVTLIMRLVNII